MLRVEGKIKLGREARVLLAGAEQCYLEGYPEWEQKIILEAQCCKEDKDD